MRKLGGLLLGAIVLASCNTSKQPPNLAYEAPSAAIAKLGYDPLALPTTAYGPGSLVTSQKGNGIAPPLKLSYLCTPEFSNIPPPIINEGASAGASQAFSGKFALDVSVLKKIGLGADISYVDSVVLKFDNVKIEELGLDALLRIRRNLGPDCTEILKQYANVAYQTQQAIRADVTYTANFKSGASAQVKNLVIKFLVANFGGSIGSSGDSSVTGKGLYYGLTLRKI